MCMKRKQLLSILLVCLSALIAKAQVDIYGFATNVNDEKQSGMVKFSSTAPATTMQRIKQVEEWATAGAWGGDAYYAMLSYATYPKGLYIIDLATGEMTQVADYMYREDVRAAIEMSYDYMTGIMYFITVSDEDENCTALGTVDLMTGAQTFINRNMKQYIVGMAIDKDGVMYGINDAGWVVRINKTTGICENRFNLELNPWRRQSMEFDRASGTLYWASCNSSKMGHLKKINVKKRTCEDVGYIGGTGEEQVVGLYIPYKPCADGAPGKVEGLKVATDPTGALSAVITWTNPTLTYAGEALTAIEKVEIYRDETLVHTLTGATPGEESQWTDQVASSGSYTYKFLVYNAEGAGIPMNTSAFIGRDIPSAVMIASVSREGNHAIRLSWYPSTKGVNNGYLDFTSITYKVTRTNDGVVLADGLTDTTFTDTSITALNRYQYSIEVSNADGTGEATTTGYIVNGPARDLPLVTDFTNESESQLWSIADVDYDGTTFFWQYNPNFKDQGFFYYQCEYKPATNANDWIISPKYKFEANKAYKAIVHARPDDISKNEMMEVWLVKDYNLNTAVKLSDTIRVTGEYDENGETILSQFRVNINPLDEAGEFSIAVRCISDMEVAYWLAIAKVEVSENLEGHIRGDVYDNEFNPVEGVVVSLEGTDYKATTDARGQFEIKNVAEGTYTTIQTKMGYESLPQTITVTGLKTVNVELDVVKRVEYIYKGKVKDEYGNPLPNALIALSGYNSYSALTDKEGNYYIDGIYGDTLSYTVVARKDFYEADTTSFNTTKVNGSQLTGDFTLNDCILPPAFIATTLAEDESAATVTWSKPAVEAHVKLHSENVSYTFGTEEGEEGTLIGLVCREPMLVDSLSWWTFCDSTSLNVVIIALNSRGNLTSKELYRDNDAPNKPYSPTTYVLSTPAYAPNGCFIGISVDKGNLSLLTTASTEEQPFIYNTNAYIEDLAVAAKLEYVEALGSDYEENFYISYSGRRLADSEAPTVTYNVLALKDGVEQYKAVGNDLLYADPHWADLDKDDYQYAVEAVYQNGKKASILSEVITKTTPSSIDAHPSDACITLIPGMMLVEAKAVQVVSANGETIVEGSGLHEISTSGWASGIYLVRTLNDGVWETNKVVIK